MSAPTPAPGDDRPREGYYPDPSIPGYVRYWNGAAWVPGTSRPAPSDGRPLTPPAGPTGSTGTTGPAAVEETGPHFFDEDPEPASAWAADAARQSGFGGDQDRRVSWGSPQSPDPRAPMDPRVPAQPAGTTGAASPPADRESGSDGDHGTVTFRAPVPRTGEQRGAGAAQAGGTASPAKPGFGAGKAAAARAAAQQAGAGAGGVGAGGVGSGGAGGASGAAGSGGVGSAGGVAGAGTTGSTGAAATSRPGGVAEGAPSTRNTPGTPGARPAAPAFPGAPTAPGTPGTPSTSAPFASGPAASATPAAPAPTPAFPQQPGAPLAPGPGGGQHSWAQQVHQLAADEQQQPVTPWRPPVEDVFQAAARRQASARPAGLGKRFAARLVDTLLLAAVTGVAAVPLGVKAVDHVDAKIDEAKLSGRTVTVWLLDGTTSVYLGIVLAVLLVFGVLYEALPTAKWGRTLGKKLFGLEVRDIEGGEPPSFGAALRRWLVYSLPGLLVVGVVGVVWGLFDKPWRQCWHDKAAHTFVAG
ncbi:RDD family protein [Streptomyces roseirectus]|uniref:RDD family protein n=1 Tax=Streptomyces roseirectus TaxID=2768066 RepID=A0A7H0II23_9ACTN|nr:RDD family protein [Streptomyces roseirectus]QNP72439.1 RDD family protein [Streptomyces roseirectus]